MDTNKKSSSSLKQEDWGLVIDRLKQDLKNDLIAGLLVIIPLATTIWLDNYHCYLGNQLPHPNFQTAESL